MNEEVPYDDLPEEHHHGERGQGDRGRHRVLLHITNEQDSSQDEIVFEANDQCNQENLIAKLKNGVRSMKMPVDNLVSNWAYMMMASLAWSLKSWPALILPAQGRWLEKHSEEKTTVLRMEFKRFIDRYIRVPAQRSSRLNGGSCIDSWLGITFSTSSSVLWRSSISRCIVEGE